MLIAAPSDSCGVDVESWSNFCFASRVGKDSLGDSQSLLIGFSIFDVPSFIGVEGLWLELISLKLLILLKWFRFRLFPSRFSFCRELF